MGLFAEFDEDGGSDATLKILEDNPEVDLLQVAHMHITVDEMRGSVPVGGVRNAGREIRELPLVREAHEKTLLFIRGGTGEDDEKGEPLGTTTARFQPENEICGLPEGMLEDTALIDLINMIQLENADADVSACALFQNTSDLPEGDIYYNKVFDIYKYDNTLYRVTVTGAELKNYMEWSAQCYNHMRSIFPGQKENGSKMSCSMGNRSPMSRR